MPFDEAKRNVDDSNAVKFRLTHPQFRENPAPYLETFVVRSVENGQIRLPVPQFLEFQEKGTLFAASPHYDDIVLTGGIILHLKERGYHFELVYMVAGSSAVIYDENGKEVTDPSEKLRIREHEELISAQTLGVVDPHVTKVEEVKNMHLLHLKFDNKDRRRKDGKRIVHRDDKEKFYGVLQTAFLKHKEENREGPFVILVPDQRDLHPAHEATERIVRWAIKKLSKEKNPNNEVELLTVSFKSPWAGRFNTYIHFTEEEIDEKATYISDSERIHATLEGGISNAIVARETTLKGGFGSHSITWGVFGGHVAERLELYTASSDGKLTRGKVSAVLADTEISPHLDWNRSIQLKPMDTYDMI